MTFPRQGKSPFLSIPDFFRRDEDLAGFLVVTLGAGLETENVRLLKRDQYQDYFLLHGFAVEVTDALAEYWHARMRAEMGFPDPKLDLQDYITQKYRGSRYGFGYPACPDLSMNKVCCDLVHASDIGVQVTENFMMQPEVTTCALVAHHPQAKYFYV
jgi:5-methyltetrahydrofolate--homocysteine methyltransferase